MVKRVTLVLLLAAAPACSPACSWASRWFDASHRLSVIHTR
jgi:hypothetical protein